MGPLRAECENENEPFGGGMSPMRAECENENEHPEGKMSPLEGSVRMRMSDCGRAPVGARSWSSGERRKNVTLNECGNQRPTPVGVWHRKRDH